LIAAVAVLADRVFTFGYFIPTMGELMNAADTPPSVSLSGNTVVYSQLLAARDRPHRVAGGPQDVRAVLPTAGMTVVDTAVDFNEIVRAVKEASRARLPRVVARPKQLRRIVTRERAAYRQTLFGEVKWRM
jgi:hypothetical protein